MAVTPETLPRHELVGLAVEVIDGADDAQIGIAGTVVGETTKTLVIETADREWQVPKATATFAVTLPDGEVVAIDGEELVARPARRTEQQGDSKWR